MAESEKRMGLTKEGALEYSTKSITLAKKKKQAIEITEKGNYQNLLGLLVYWVASDIPQIEPC